MANPHKWSPISYKSSAGQRRHIGQRPMLYRWTTQPTVRVDVAAPGTQFFGPHSLLEVKKMRAVCNHRLLSLSRSPSTEIQYMRSHVIAYLHNSCNRCSDNRCSDNRCSDNRYSDNRYSDNRCSDNWYFNKCYIGWQWYYFFLPCVCSICFAAITCGKQWEAFDIL